MPNKQLLSSLTPVAILKKGSISIQNFLLSASQILNPQPFAELPPHLLTLNSPNSTFVQSGLPNIFSNRFFLLIRFFQSLFGLRINSNPSFLYFGSV